MKRATQFTPMESRYRPASTMIQNPSRCSDDVAMASSTAWPTTTGVRPLQTKAAAMAMEATKLHGRCDSATQSVHLLASSAGSLDRCPPGPGNAA